MQLLFVLGKLISKWLSFWMVKTNFLWNMADEASSLPVIAVTAAVGAVVLLLALLFNIGRGEKKSKSDGKSGCFWFFPFFSAVYHSLVVQWIRDWHVKQEAWNRESETAHFRPFDTRVVFNWWWPIKKLITLLFLSWEVSALLVL